MKKLLLILIPFMLLAADGDTLEYNSDYTDFADGDTFFVDVQFKPPFDSIQSIINGRLGNVNIADDAEIDVNKLDTLDTLITKGLRTTYAEIDTLKKIDSGYISIFVADTIKSCDSAHVGILDADTIETKMVNILDGKIAIDSIRLASGTWLKNYTEASFACTTTGMVTEAVGLGYYVKTGNLVSVFLPSMSGTSDATSFTIKGFPSTIQEATAGPILIQAKDNGSWDVTTAIAPDGDSEWALLKDGSVAGWTNSGAKGIDSNVNFTFILPSGF